VLAGSLAELVGSEERRFAAIVFWHSLEHLPDPAGDLARAAGLLVPGGVIVIAVPNAASLQAAWFGDGWLALDLPRHLVHIPAGALLARLRRLGPGGMRVERVSYLRGGQAVFGMLHGLVGWLSGGRLDLYDAIRRPEAQQVRLAGVRRLVALAAGALLLPVAGGLALVEAGLRRGGTVYVEARRANADR
jgi:SAM-dependent methyltransferase